MGPVKFATVAAMFWGIAGFTVGLYIASELAFPILNLDLPWTTFGRLRPLHTSAVIFAFGGNVLIGTSFYVVQRTCRARLAGDLAPWFVVLGYIFFILIAGTGYLLGITQSKERADQERAGGCLDLGAAAGDRRARLRHLDPDHHWARLAAHHYRARLDRSDLCHRHRRPSADAARLS
jgi:hypothetical protein